MAVAMALWGVVLVAGGFTTDEEVTEPLAYVVTGLFLLCYALLFVLMKLTGKQRRRLLSRVIALVAFAEVVINMAVTGFYSTSRTSYRQKMENYEELISIAEEGELFCRIEDPGRKTKNDNALYGYASVTQFSSLMNVNVSHFYQSLYMEGGQNYYCYNGAIPLTSAMLSVKYILSDSAQEESAYRRLVAQAGDQYLYENTYCLPLGYMMDEDAIAAWDSTNSSRRSSLNSLAQALGAEGELLLAADCIQNAQPGETDISILEDGYYYAAYINCNQDTLKGILSGGRNRTYAKTTHRYLLDLGYCSAGDELAITNKGNETISFYVYRLNEKTLEQAYNTLNSQTMELTGFSDTRVEGEIDVQQAGRLILSIPDEAGWTLYVDGEETPTEAFADALISVHLEEGHHTIQLSYRTPYLDVGAAVSLGSVLCFLLLMLLCAKRKK
jgi:uncharacterized membrane protein YfhO